MKKILIFLSVLIWPAALRADDLSGPSQVCYGVSYNYVVNGVSPDGTTVRIVWSYTGSQTVTTVNSTTRSIAWTTDGSVTALVQEREHTTDPWTTVSTLVVNVSVKKPGAISVGISYICSGASFTISRTTVGLGDSFSWQSSPYGANSWTTIASGTYNGSLSTSISQKTDFRIVLNDCSSNNISNVVTVDVYGAITSAGGISGTITTWYATSPPILTSTGNAVANGSYYSYQWQSRLYGGSWSNLSGATSATYQPGLIFAPTEFRRLAIQQCDFSSSASNTVTISVLSPKVKNSNTASIALGNTVTIHTNSQSYSSVQWVKDGSDVTIANGFPANATDTTYVVSQPGNYQFRANLPGIGTSSTSGILTIYPLGGQYDSASNTVVSTRIRKSGVSTATNLYATAQPSDYSQSIVFSDGIGRATQTISVGMSPAAKDVVQPLAYDSLTPTSYLPYIATDRSGWKKKKALSGTGTSGYLGSDQYAFYQQTNAKIDPSTYPFAKSKVENSPLARMTEQGAPGADWQPGGHTVKPEFYTNAASDVRTWSLSGPTGYYAAKTLSVSKVIDENGNVVSSFSDKLGHTVLKRVQADGSTNLDTYYLYDTRGNLVLQIPPKAAAKAASWHDSLKVAYCFQYTYDTRNRLVEKQVPGTRLPQYYVYDRLGRLILTQDGNQRLTRKWAFVKYDIANRPVMTGIYTNTTHTTRSDVQQYVADPLYSNPNTVWYEERGSTLHGYTNQSFPTANAPSGSIDVLTVAYYDDYDFNNNNTADWSYVAQGILGEQSQGNSFGLPTGSKRKILGDTAWIRTYQFYDRFGRSIQVRSSNHLSPAVKNLTTVGYDFEGKVLQTKTRHYGGGTNTTLTLTRNEYDFAGRLVRIYHSTDSLQEVVSAWYKYNELGQMIEKNLHCIDCGDASVVSQSNTREAWSLTKSSYSEVNLLAVNSIELTEGFDNGAGTLDARIVSFTPTVPGGGGTYLQSIDYRYHVRGWLKSINNAQLNDDSGASNDDTGDYFGTELAYNSSVSGLSNAATYNGNISAVRWKANGSSGAADQRSYSYTYDKSERLLTSTFKANNGSSWGKENNTLNETMTYDLNGNIKKLGRKYNNRSATGVDTPAVMDTLTYNYAAGYGNRISAVKDGGTTVGFKDGVTATYEYVYDTLGNLTIDRNKGIDKIKYNVLGKPDTVHFSDNHWIRYIYDASGTKLTVKNYNTSGTLTTTTDYAGGFVYVNSSLSFFSSPEGRIVKNSGKYEYQYALQDHQGNTRILFTSAQQTAVAVKATFEGNSADQVDQFNNVNPSYIFIVPEANHTPPGDSVYQAVIGLSQGYPVGPSKSLKVYPGDMIDLDVWAYYSATSGYGTSTAAMVTAIATAFGGSSTGSGESLQIYNGVNGAIGAYGLGPNAGNTKPAAFLNYILFDTNYKVITAGWQGITASAGTKEHLVIPTLTVKEAGYLFAYLSYEDQSNNVAYFDDFTVSHTPTNVIQSNEYYSHGMPTASSWTRENALTNNFLGNGGTELNSTSQLYDLEYRNFDAALARMNQVDPLAHSYGSVTPYNYSFNNPIAFVDVNGAKAGPWSQDFAESYIGSDYGNRNSWAKLVAHGGMDQYVGGAGEGWNGYMGNFNLSAAGFGFGAIYVNPSMVVDANYGAEQAAKAFTYKDAAVKVGVTYENPARVNQYVYQDGDKAGGIGGLVHIGSSGSILSMTASVVRGGDESGWVSVTSTHVFDLEGKGFSYCASCLNPASLFGNLRGMSYPGGDNPVDFSGKYSYAFVPRSAAEYPAIGHDRRYDNLGTSGVKGLLTDTRAIGADWRFVDEEWQVAFQSRFPLTDRLNAAILASGLGMLALPKTIYQVTQPAGFIKILMDFQVSNIGVDNKPR